MSEEVKTILVVDDEEAVREVLARFLERESYQVLLAAGGTEALTLSKSHSGPIDLLVADVIMSPINGRELAERLLGERPQLRILFISGYVDDPALREDIAQGRLEFLAKPFTRQELVGKVQQLLQLDRERIQGGTLDPSH